MNFAKHILVNVISFDISLNSKYHFNWFIEIEPSNIDCVHCRQKLKLTDFQVKELEKFFNMKLDIDELHLYTNHVKQALDVCFAKERVIDNRLNPDNVSFSAVLKYEEGFHHLYLKILAEYKTVG